MIEFGDIYLNNESDELLLIKTVVRSEFNLGILYCTFENMSMHMNVGEHTVIVSGTDRFPIIFPNEIRNNYRKIGKL